MRGYLRAGERGRIERHLIDRALDAVRERELCGRARTRRCHRKRLGLELRLAPLTAKETEVDVQVTSIIDQRPTPMGTRELMVLPAVWKTSLRFAPMATDQPS